MEIRYQVSWTAMVDGEVRPWGRCTPEGYLLVSGSLSLPTGAATAANQVTEINGATGTSRILSAAATTNATSAKATAGSVRQITGFNAAVTARYLKFYNKASAPTVGTDTPRKTIYLPAGTAFVIDCNDYYATGIAYALTTGLADADTGALTAGDILALNVDYI